MANKTTVDKGLFDKTGDMKLYTEKCVSDLCHTFDYAGPGHSKTQVCHKFSHMKTCDSFCFPQVVLCDNRQGLIHTFCKGI